MMRDKYKIKSQMLHAYELLIPSAVYTAKNPDIAKHGESIIRESDALRIVTTIPPEFLRVLKGENIWQHGIPEVLEALH
jgi:23S rRNA pseudouridine955/2504/2580 synthase